MFFSGKSDIGKRRATNQDSFSILTLPGNSCLLTVCDGMGGANGGNIASELACRVYTESVRDGFTPDMTDRGGLLKKAVAAANTAVFNAAAANEDLRGMGTTLVSALVSPDGNVTAINVGDSRMYCIGGGEYIKGLMDRDELLNGLCVRGEISNYKLYPSGHHYFSLTQQRQQ